MSDRVVRYHTYARRQPSLIGKDSSGKRIPGGPYTVYQPILLVATAAVLWISKDLWSTSLMQALIVTACLALAVGWISGRIDFSGRNPFLLGAGVLNAWASNLSAPQGKIRGARLPAWKQVKVTGICDTTVLADVDQETAAELWPDPEDDAVDAASKAAQRPSSRDGAARSESTSPTPLATFLAAAGRQGQTTNE